MEYRKIIIKSERDGYLKRYIGFIENDKVIIVHANGFLGTVLCPQRYFSAYRLTLAKKTYLLPNQTLAEVLMKSALFNLEATVKDGYIITQVVYQY